MDEARNERLYRRLGFAEPVKLCFLDPCARDENMAPQREETGFRLLAKAL